MLSLFKIMFTFTYKTAVTLRELFNGTLKAFDDFKNKQKSVWSTSFWYVKACIFWKCIQYTIHWDATQILKKFPSNKINSTKNALFFLLRAPTHYSLNFNLRFLYELKHKVGLSEALYGIFPFLIPFRFC